MANKINVDVAIIGAGYSGTKITDNISYARFPDQIKVALIDTDKENFGAGLAYSPASCAPYHQTNLAAGRMQYASDYTHAEYMSHRSNAETDEPQYRLAVSKRQDIAEFLNFHLGQAEQRLESPNPKKKLTRIFGEAVSITTSTSRSFSNSHQIKLSDGKKINAHAVVLAMGNPKPKQHPLITPKMLEDDSFNDKYIGNQWLAESREKIKALCKTSESTQHKTAVIWGTGLSGDDAFRDLVYHGFKGKIIMISRNGYRHFSYPLTQKLKQAFVRPSEEFFSNLDHGEYSAVIAELSDLFEQQTGIRYDPKTKTIERQNMLDRLHQKTYTSEEVITVFQRYIPYIISVIGPKNFGNILRAHGSALNVLRVGAGYDVSNEIQAALESGQLEIIAASIDNIFYKDGDNKIKMAITHKHSGEQEIIKANLVISSLGPNYNFAQSKHPLWKSLFKQNVVSAHPTGYGLDIAENSYGTLTSKASGLFAAGPLTSGYRMCTEGIIGPPAFSMPGMRNSLDRVSNEIVDYVKELYR